MFVEVIVDDKKIDLSRKMHYNRKYRKIRRKDKMKNNLLKVPVTELMRLETVRLNQLGIEFTIFDLSKPGLIGITVSPDRNTMNNRSMIQKAGYGPSENYPKKRGYVAYYMSLDDMTEIHS